MKLMLGDAELANIDDNVAKALLGQLSRYKGEVVITQLSANQYRSYGSDFVLADPGAALIPFPLTYKKRETVLGVTIKLEKIWER